MRKYLLFLWLFPALYAQAQLNLQLLAHVPNDSGVTLAGCWHYVDSSANEYALIGHRLGLDIYDVSVPTAPVRRFRVPGLVNNWREVKVWNGFAYVGSEANGSGITIVDLRQLPDTVQYKVFTGEGLTQNQILRSHTVGAKDGYLYVYGGPEPLNGAVIFSLEDPWNPVYVGKYATNYLHDGFVRGDTLWGSEIYKGQFSVIDIQDRANPVLLATQSTPGLFNHNSELSKTGQYLFTADEVPSAPLGAYDVSDLGNITLTDIYLPSQRPAGEVHNVRHFGDDYLVCPSYQGQLTIVDASDPYNLIETGWAIMGNSLVWDANPYLPSGIIFATAKAEGMFIYQPTYTRAARIQGIITDANTGFSLTDAKIFVENTSNADTTNMDGKYATGAAQSGVYAIRVERSGYIGQTTAQELTAGTVKEVNFALQPENVSVSDAVSRQNARIFPSVVQNGFTVELTAGFAAQSPWLRLHNAQGRPVLNRQLSATATYIPLDVPSGVYMGTVGNTGFKVVVVK